MNKNFSLEEQISYLETQIRTIRLASLVMEEERTHGCTNGCTGSCPDPTGNCTYGCTNGCTNGCTSGCAEKTDHMLDSLEKIQAVKNRP